MPRLDVLLSRCLGCSRTAAARAIEAGRVRDDKGAPLGDRRLEIDAGALPFALFLDQDRHQLFDAFSLLLHKPRGVVTALRDERHPTAYQLLRGAPLFTELRPVGRLDLDSSGLLLWTTDGQWVQRLTHPKRNIPRHYQAALARPFRALPPALILEDGYRPTITRLEPLADSDRHPALAVPPEVTALASITVVGGAYHEVRRIFAALGSHVLGLCRVGFGRLALPTDLEPGRYRPVDFAAEV